MITVDEVKSIFDIEEYTIREDATYFYVSIDKKISRKSKWSIKEKLGLYLDICNDIEDVFGEYTLFIIRKYK